MALINQPNLLPMAFAIDGDRNTIPDNNDGLSGYASIAKGFPPITQKPLANGGIPPQRADFNGIFNLFSQFILYTQNGGMFQYTDTLDYQPPSIVAEGNNFYRCIKENGEGTLNGVQPLTNKEFWELIPTQSQFDDMQIEISNSGLNQLQRNKYYTTGDYAYSNKIPSWTYLECVTAGTSGDAEPDLSQLTINSELTDGTAVFKLYRKGLQDKPVGSIFQSATDLDPNTYFGGVWEAMPAGRVLLAQGSSDWGVNYAAGSTGGEATHTLSVGEMPSHSHSGTTSTNGWHNHTAKCNGHSGSSHTFSSWESDSYQLDTTVEYNGNHTHSFTTNGTGSNQGHNNLQPYLACYFWKRTA